MYVNDSIIVVKLCKIFTVNDNNHINVFNSAGLLQSYDIDNDSWTENGLYDLDNVIFDDNSDYNNFATVGGGRIAYLIDLKTGAVGRCDTRFHTYTAYWQKKQPDPGQPINSSETSNLNVNVHGGYPAPISDKDIRFTNMPTSRLEAGVICMRESIYVIGGEKNGKYLNTVEKYDIDTNTWYTLDGMNVARCNFGIASLNNKIYGIGGIGDTGCLNTVEELDPYSGCSGWTLKSNMPTSRRGLGAVALDNEIYAVGGFDGTNYLNTVNALRVEGKTGLQSYSIYNETIKVFIKSDGTFDTAYGLHKLSVDFFIK